MVAQSVSRTRPDWVSSDTVSLDLQGETCPIPEITVAKKLKSMSSGQVVEVLTDHQPAADVTLPALAKTFGHEYYVERAGNFYRVFIKR
jgi:tRNA 2-thiouridine synthesizing protein A